MCGIVHVKRKDSKDAIKMTWKRYISQKNRGTQGFGYVAIRNDRVINVGRSALEKDIDTLIHKEENIDEVLFHHRYPTSTPNFAEATHPILVSNKMLDFDYLVVHNGVITNDTKLKEKYTEMGFVFTTNIRHEYITRETVYFDEQFNDSEAFAIDLALTLENKKAEMESEGNIAFIALQVNKKNSQVIRTFWGRNSGNPLVIDDNKSFMSITSEGTGVRVEADILFSLDHITGYRTNEDKKIGKSYTDYYTKNQYKYNKEDDWYNRDKSSLGVPAQNLLGFGGYNGEEDDEDLSIVELDREGLLDDREKYLGKIDFELIYGQSYVNIKPDSYTNEEMVRFYEERAYLEDEMTVAMNGNNYDYGDAINQLIDMINLRIDRVEEFWRSEELDNALNRGSVPSIYSGDVDSIAIKATSLLFPKQKEDGE